MSSWGLMAIIALLAAACGGQSPARPLSEMKGRIMSKTEARDEAASPLQPAGGASAPVPPNGHARGRNLARSRRRGWLAAAVVLVVAAGVGGASVTALFSSSDGAGGSSNSGYATSLATVTRQSLTSQTEIDATLGDAGTWTVTAAQSSSSAGASPSSGSSASGTLTWLPQVGWTVRQGQAIYKVSGIPAVLLYGNVPAYRDLSEGLTGPDVTELNTDLVKLGYLKASSLGPRSGWDYYSAETAYGVEQFQLHYGLTETGTLSLGEAVFLPGRALITGWGTGISSGGPATPGAAILTASSTTPVVSIALDPGLQGEVKVGDPVSITLPDGAATPGVVSQVQRVATSSSSSNSSGNQGGGAQNGSSTGATITVLASLTHPKAAGELNQAPVTVTITTGSVSDAIVVPVNALLAESGGKFCVEVASGSRHHLVSVVPGLFDDAAGLVQVTGNLTPGEHVVVPGI
jgi:Putative peptidoglycan binding domain